MTELGTGRSHGDAGNPGTQAGDDKLPGIVEAEEDYVTLKNGGSYIL